MTETILLLVWGVVVGLDLVSGPQVMWSRPLVAGTVAGAILGDVAAGALVGAVMELFAMDVIAVGAVRYPDYGLGAVAAGAAAAAAPDILGLGVAVMVGLVVAYLGEEGIQWVRRQNTRDVRACREALDGGDRSAVRGVHLRCLLRDTTKSLAVTAAGLVVAQVVRRWPLLSVRGAVLLTLCLIAASLASGAWGAVRVGGLSRHLVWFALGLAGGTVWVVLA